MFAVVLEQHIGGCRAASTKKKSVRPTMAKNCQYFAERMHESFVGSLTTARVGDGPTETCLELYWSSLLGVARPPAQKKTSFRPKMAKIWQFFAENSVFLAGVVSCRAPYRILRVPDPLKSVWNCIGATYWDLQGRQHKKKTVFVQKWPKIDNFWPKTVYFWRSIGQEEPPSPILTVHN